MLYKNSEFRNIGWGKADFFSTLSKYSTHDLVNIEGGYYAVLRYSGRASDGNFIKHKEILEKELNKNNISIISPPIRATYDSPFTLPMNRRNEAMYKVEFNS